MLNYKLARCCTRDAFCKTFDCYGLRDRSKSCYLPFTISFIVNYIACKRCRKLHFCIVSYQLRIILAALRLGIYAGRFIGRDGFYWSSASFDHSVLYESNHLSLLHVVSFTTRERCEIPRGQVAINNSIGEVRIAAACIGLPLLTMSSGVY